MLAEAKSKELFEQVLKIHIENINLMLHELVDEKNVKAYNIIKGIDNLLDAAKYNSDMYDCLPILLSKSFHRMDKKKANIILNTVDNQLNRPWWKK